MHDPGQEVPRIGDRYDVLERVGEDELFTDYRARDRQENRMVRLRLLRPDVAESASLIDGLRRDIGAVFSFQAESIVRVLDMGEAPVPNRIFVVEEYSRATDLSIALRRSGALAWDSVVKSMVPVAEALTYALDRGVVHGGLSPECIQTVSSGAVLVRGYGEASAVAMARRLRGRGAEAGNRFPPECRGNRVPDHPLHDVWMFGALMYELLCGRFPEVSSGDGGLGSVDDRNDPRRHKPGIPEAVAGIVMKCLAANAVERYQNPRALLSDLRQVLADLAAGESLAWSPLSRPNTGLSQPVAPVRSTRSTGERPRIAPAPGGREEPMESRAAGTDGDEPERRQVGWLVVAMLVSGFLLVASVGLVYVWVQPFLKPASVVLVPNLVGLSESEAAALARDRGIQIQVVDRQYRDDPPAGRIYQMREKVGDPIRPGQPIAVWVSKGPEMVEVPDVSRMGLDKARQVLEAAGLKVGTVTRVYDFTEPAGNVVEQGGLAGERKPRGSSVELTVSRGPEPDPVAEPEPPSDPIPAKPPTGQSKSTEAPSVPAPGERFLSIPYEVPTDGKSHRIRVDVEDEDGLHTGYDQVHEPGESVKIEVKAVGSKATIRLYDNDVLKGTAQ